MLLFRLADVPRTARRLTPPLSVALDATGPGVDGAAGVAVAVEWTLRPALLNRRSGRTRERVAEALALYAAAEGWPRAAVEELAPRIEDILDDYRLARCVARTVEALGYHFAPPPRALPAQPAALRALCYRRAQEQYRGYVPRAWRALFLDSLAAELGATPEELEEALWADRPGAALLRAGPVPDANSDGDGASTADGGAPVAIPPDPAHVIAAYNAAAVATVLAASSLVALSLPATETAALKDLYRHAKLLHVGVEIAARSPASGEARGEAGEMFTATLYGPGSRALVRGRRVTPATATPVAAPARADAPDADGPSVRGNGDPSGGPDDRAADYAPDPGGVGDGVSVPAPGGPPVAAVMARLARRHPGAVRDGWALVLGPDRRLFRASLDEEALAALGGATDDRAGTGDDGADEVAEVDATGGDPFDSLVEADFARAFRAAEAGGRLGIARGWTVEREPRAVLVDGSVFLPDFSFRRGDAEVLCEVIGYYTEDYLARKRHKLALLRGQIPLLLVVDEERAPLFAASGFPVVTYRAGRQISLTDVVQALDSAFDPFARRRARAGRALAALCAAPGPRLSEEELCTAVGCAGRGELAGLWADLTGAAVESREAAAGSAGAPAFGRRYVPGYGLAPAAALGRARQALGGLLDEASIRHEAVPLEEALACCARAGVPDPDDALIAELGGVVVRAGLFGAAGVYRAGVEADDALAAALTAPPPRRRRRA